MTENTDAPSATARPWSVEDPMGPEVLSIVQADKPTYEWSIIASVHSDDNVEAGERGISRATMRANAALIVTAVNERETLLARIAELEAALRPFAALMEGFSDPSWADQDVLTICAEDDSPIVRVPVSIFRIAHAALSPQPEARRDKR